MTVASQDKVLLDDQEAATLNGLNTRCSRVSHNVQNTSSTFQSRTSWGTTNSAL